MYIKNGDFMKKFLIILGILVTCFLFVLIICSLCENLNKDMFLFDKVDKINVQSGKMECYVSTSWYMSSWTYDYIIEDNILYITVYQHSLINIFATQKHDLNIKISKGYNDFDKIYINGNGKDKILIWEKENNKY